MAKSKNAGSKGKEVDPWEAQKVLASGLERFLDGVRLRYPCQQTRDLCRSLSQVAVTLSELADVQVVPIVIITYQRRLTEELLEQQELDRRFPGADWDDAQD